MGLETIAGHGKAVGQYWGPMKSRRSLRAAPRTPVTGRADHAMRILATIPCCVRRPQHDEKLRPRSRAS